MSRDWIINKLRKIVTDLQKPNSQYAQEHDINAESTKQFKIDQTIDRLENLIDMLQDDSAGSGPMIGGGVTHELSADEISRR